MKYINNLNIITKLLNPFIGIQTGLDSYVIRNNFKTTKCINDEITIPLLDNLILKHKQLNINEFKNVDTVNSVVDEVIGKIREISIRTKTYRDSFENCTPEMFFSMLIHPCSMIATYNFRGAANFIIVPSNIKKSLEYCLNKTGNGFYTEHNHDELYLVKMGAINGGCVDLYEYCGNELEDIIVGYSNKDGQSDCGLVLNIINNKYKIVEFNFSDRYYMTFKGSANYLENINL